MTLQETGPRERNFGYVLTQRDRDILGLTAKGKIAKEIADKLNFAPATIKGIKGRIFTKLGAVNSLNAVLIALKRGGLQNEEVADPAIIARVPLLTPRQVDVMDAMVLDLGSHPEIPNVAVVVNLAPKTVKNYRDVIYATLGTSKMVPAAVNYYIATTGSE